MPRIIPSPEKIYIDNADPIDVIVTNTDPIPVDVTGGGTLDPVSVAFADGVGIDPFGRQRISSPQLRLSTIFDTGKRENYWSELAVGTGLAVHLPNEYSIRMQVSLTNDEVIRQTKEYFVYRAGQGQLILATFKFDTPETNLIQEVGYYDANDGIFLQTQDETISMVKRTSTSGSPVDTKIEQPDWNIDPLDGTGPSGITLDLTKTQILVIDFQWLGVGRVRTGFDIDGVIVPVHQFLHANVLTEAYMKTPKLPVRYRIKAAGLLSGTRHMKQICSTVIREGMSDEPNTAREVDTGLTSKTVSTVWQTIVGIRLKALNNRATLKIIGSTYMNESTLTAVEFGVVVNPGGTGAAVWTDSTQSGSVFQLSRSVLSISVNVLTGDITAGVALPLGEYIGSSVGSARGTTVSTKISETLALGADVAGTTLDECWIVARAFSGTAATRGILKFEEIR